MSEPITIASDVKYSSHENLPRRGHHFLQAWTIAEASKQCFEKKKKIYVFCICQPPRFLQPHSIFSFLSTPPTSGGLKIFI